MNTTSITPLNQTNQFFDIPSLPLEGFVYPIVAGVFALIGFVLSAFEGKKLEGRVEIQTEEKESSFFSELQELSMDRNQSKQSREIYAILSRLPVHIKKMDDLSSTENTSPGQIEILQVKDNLETLTKLAPKMNREECKKILKAIPELGQMLSKNDQIHRKSRIRKLLGDLKDEVLLQQVTIPGPEKTSFQIERSLIKTSVQVEKSLIKLLNLFETTENPISSESFHTTVNDLYPLISKMSEKDCNNAQDTISKLQSQLQTNNSDSKNFESFKQRLAILQKNIAERLNELSVKNNS